MQTNVFVFDYLIWLYCFRVLLKTTEDFKTRTITE